jgi:hypothetical protein
VHRSDEDLVLCADCGGVLRLGDRAFTFSATGALCAECAMRRGGVYEASRDTWTEEPSLDGLGDLSD